MSQLHRDTFEEICPSSLLPIRMRDKWAPLILRCLADGPRRFSELQVPIHRASAKALTAALRGLERDGFVARTNAGRAVSYRLTPLGQSLLDQFESWCAWASQHWDELLDARDPDPAVTTR
jgi:DNA-binding HxlR family transcriptional regulator